MRAPHLDILKKQSDGTLLWIEAARDVRTAEERLTQLAGAEPGEYFVFDHNSQKVVAKVEKQSIT
jgi:hypothetical protein